jgi:phosphatidylserine/phosphatidylglycerophosphate/cardiolipin synthase-like enzyme
LSALGKIRPDDEDVVLVFRPPENPAAQIAGITPFKSLRLRLEELLEWFKGLNVDSIDLWIEGAYRTGNHTELFLSVEGKTGAKITIRPYARREQAIIQSPKIQDPQLSETREPVSKEAEIAGQNAEKMTSEPQVHPVAAFFSPDGGVERHVVSLIDSATLSIEMAAYQFTNVYIEKALLEAAKRGVKVSLVMDRSETIGPQAAVYDRLEEAGAQIRLFTPSNGKMNDKYIVVDGKTVQWGSYNYTERAEAKNYDNATFATDRKLAEQYHDDFEAMFNQAKPEPRVLRSIRRFFRHI